MPGDIGVRSLQDWARCDDGAADRVPVRPPRLTRTDAETAHHVGFRAIRAGRAGGPAHAGTAGGRAGRADGSELPRRARAGGRLRQERGRASTRWRRSGSASSRSARSPDEPQPGNPRPRLFRLPTDRAIVNRMGFNNDGAEVVAATAGGTAASPTGRRAGSSLGVNIGKTKVVPEDEAVDDYRAEHPAAGAARRLPGGQRELAEHPGPARPPGGGEARSRCWPPYDGSRCTATDRQVPLLVKIAPDLSDDDVLAVADLAWPSGLDGIVATNTTISRDGLRSTAAEVEARRSRRAVRSSRCVHRSLEVLRMLRARVGRGADADRRRRHRDRRRRGRAARGRRRPAAGLHGLHLPGAGLAGQDEPRAGPSYRARTLREGRVDEAARPTVRRPAPRRDGRPRAAVRRDRPAPRAARRLGADRLGDRPGAVRARPPPRRWRRRSRWSSRSRRSSSGSGPPGSRCSSGWWRPRDQAGALVVLDVKRGDIGSTAQAYADAYLDPRSPLLRRDHRLAVPRLRQPRPDARAPRASTTPGCSCSP